MLRLADKSPALPSQSNMDMHTKKKKKQQPKNKYGDGGGMLNLRFHHSPQTNNGLMAASIIYIQSMV